MRLEQRGAKWFLFDDGIITIASTDPEVIAAFVDEQLDEAEQRVDKLERELGSANDEAEALSEIQRKLETMRYHDDCGYRVRPDDFQEPKWFCDRCQDTVRTEDTHLRNEL